MISASSDFWESRYQDGDTGWDVGHVSGPLRQIIDQLSDLSSRILVPGAGNAYEVAYLREKGFEHVFLLDWASTPLQRFAHQYPDFPSSQLLQCDFFQLEGTFDIVLEQTFFCALPPAQRPDYVDKMHEVLNPGGMLLGVLFDAPLNDDKPPYGGNVAAYRMLFSRQFAPVSFTPCPDSEPSRQHREVYIRAMK